MENRWENLGLSSPLSAERRESCSSVVLHHFGAIENIGARVHSGVAPRNLGGNVPAIYRGRMRFLMVFRRDGLDLATPNRAILCVVFAPLICIAIMQSFCLALAFPSPWASRTPMPSMNSKSVALQQPHRQAFHG
jgi:hypothetical protein